MGGTKKFQPTRYSRSRGGGTRASVRLSFAVIEERQMFYQVFSYLFLSSLSLPFPSIALWLCCCEGRVGVGTWQVVNVVVTCIELMSSTASVVVASAVIPELCGDLAWGVWVWAHSLHTHLLPPHTGGRNAKLPDEQHAFLHIFHLDFDDSNHQPSIIFLRELYTIHETRSVR